MVQSTRPCRLAKNHNLSPLPMLDYNEYMLLPKIIQDVLFWMDSRWSERVREIPECHNGAAYYTMGLM